MSNINGKNHPNWRGGKSGYYRNKGRKIMENKLKRKLREGEVVHHKDRNIKNNEISNLQLLKNQSEHLKKHNEEDKLYLKATKIRGRPIREKHGNKIIENKLPR